MNNRPILYSFRRCPFAIRARLALVYSEISLEHREVKLNNLPGAMLAISPKATVPVLQLSDGSVLEESLDIIDWSLSIKDPHSWLDHNDQTLIEENDAFFKPRLDKYKYADRHPELSQSEHLSSCLPFLSKLEYLLQNSTYLGGDRQGRTDIAIVPFIRQFAGVEPEWFSLSEFSSTRRWLKIQVESDLFKKVMQKHPVWQPGERPVYI